MTAIGKWGLAALALMLACSSIAHAQEPMPQPPANRISLEKQVAELTRQVAQLSKEVAELEAERDASGGAKALPATADPAPLAQATGEAPASETAAPAKPVLAAAPAEPGTAGLFAGTTINMTLDGYYEYNFNSPVGRVNLLRAYDVSSNSFSLNQAAVILERAPDLAAGRRLGARLDLQYGQATETLQGSAANELRPQAYRAVFQAYGTYIAPLGSGLTLDFGKWASALGIENNYTKDQMNYSRSFLFNFLPFYHMGFRAGYNLTKKLNVTYWLVNGVNQTEDFNGFKSQAFIFTWNPAPTLSWNVNYYFGEEQPDVLPALNPGLPGQPTQPGLPVVPVVPVPNGREHIFDTYATWSAAPKLTFAGEADYVVNRVFAGSAPRHATGGAAYLRYQLTPRLDFAGRVEYLSDRSGLFSGMTQALKETTLTAEYRIAQGFALLEEWRRDFSNQPFFLTSAPGALKKEQNTATVGLVWWWGGKEGAW